MANWFGSNLTTSLDSLKNQVTSSLKEVFEETEVDDPEADLSVTKERLDSLQKLVERQKQELGNLKSQNEELLEQKQAIEMQKEDQCQQFRDLLKEKEEEILSLSIVSPPNEDENQIGDIDSEKKIKELENILQKERESHENELLAMQEAFHSRAHRSCSKIQFSFICDPSIRGLSEQWMNSSSEQEREEVFIDALKRFEACVQKNVEREVDSLEEGVKDFSKTDELKVHIEELQEELIEQKRINKQFAVQKEVEKIQEDSNNFDEVIKLKSELEDSQEQYSALFETHAALEQELASTREKLVEAESKHARLRVSETRLQEMSSVESEKDELLLKVQVLEEKLTHATENEDKLKEISMLLSDAKTEKENCVLKVQTLKDRLQQVVDEKQHLDKTIENLQAEHQQSISFILESKEAIIVEKNELSNANEALENEICQIRKKVIQLENEVNQHSKNQSIIKATLLDLHCQDPTFVEAVHRNDIQMALQVMIRNSTNQTDSEADTLLRKELEAQHRNVEDLRNEKVLLENECSELKEKVERLLQDLVELKNQNSELMTNNAVDENCSSNIKALQDEINQLEETLRTERASKSRYEEDAHSFEKRYSQLKEDKTIVEDERSILQEKCLVLERDVQSLIEKLEKSDECFTQETAAKLQLESQIEETIQEKDKLDKRLKEVLEQTVHYEEAIEALQQELAHLKNTSSQVEEFRALTLQRQEELANMKSELDERGQEIERMHQSTGLYKDQYENLLVEYNQYLSDLDVVQESSKKMETQASVYEEEIRELREQGRIRESKLEETTAELDELKEREIAREKSQIVFEEIVADLEKTLNKERTSKRELREELEEKLEEKEIMLEELRQELQGNEKEKQSLEEKEKDESELEDLRARFAVVQKELEELRKGCPDRSEESVDDLKKRMEEYQDQNNKLTEELEEKNRMLVEWRETEEKENNEEKTDMTKEAVQKLSNIIRDKDLEIEALKGRNESLVALVTKDTEKEELKEQMAALLQERQEIIQAMTQKHQESLQYHAEVQKLTEANEALAKEKALLIEKANLIPVTAEKSRDREKAPRRRFFSVGSGADLASLDDDGDDDQDDDIGQKLAEKDVRLAEKSSELDEAMKKLRETEEMGIRFQEEVRQWKRKAESQELHLSGFESQVEDLKRENDGYQHQVKALADENTDLSGTCQRLRIGLEEKEHDLKMAERNMDQLRALVNEKSENTESQQQERLKSIAAIEELQSSIGHLKKERDSYQLQVGDKDRELKELRREVNNVIDKKRRCEQELERLREHLLAVEDGYTQEALSSENRERELRKKLEITEEALRVASVQHSSASQEASVYLDALERKVDDLTKQRDELSESLRIVQDRYQQQSFSLENLQMALEGFQREKDNDVKLAAKDFAHKLSQEKSVQASLQQEITSLTEKLRNANDGLAAAGRLSEQLERKSQMITTLKQEIKLREELLKKAHNELNSLSSNNTGKVDRYLVKNLVVGFVSADGSKKPEILKIIATVLDFNKEERQKTGLDGAANSWLGGWFGGASPRRGRTTSEVQAATGLDQSLAQAFVRFLETESTPKVPPKLPVSEMTQETLHDSRPNSTSSDLSHGDFDRSSPNPLLMGAASHALPTFSVNRSSSAILKHVLHEEGPANS